MSIKPPTKYWWDEPLLQSERVWLAVAIVWCLVMTLMMPVWHIGAKQNPSSESYRITPENFDRLTDEFIEKYKVGEEQGLAVVQPPANSDIFLRAAQFQWDPVLKLKVNQTYRLHTSSLDVQHGLSIFPINFNSQVLPGYDYVWTITPTSTGEFNILCNEFCGIGHHMMVGKIYVEP